LWSFYYRGHCVTLPIASKPRCWAGRSAWRADDLCIACLLAAPAPSAGGQIRCSCASPRDL
jgi:hypothetical protein